MKINAPCRKAYMVTGISDSLHALWKACAKAKGQSMNLYAKIAILEKCSAQIGDADASNATNTK